MNGRFEGPEREPAYDDDPVAAFFARERDAVRPETADEVTWARIARAGRRRRPGRMLQAAVGAAAVAVVAGVGIWTIQDPSPSSQNAGQPAATSTSTSPGESTGQSPNSGGGSTQSKGAQDPLTGPMQATQDGPAQRRSAVPDSFTTWSLSNAGGGVVYALGADRCGGLTCPVLLRSSDNGSSWSAVHTFDGSRAAGGVRPGDPRIQGADQVREVRFVSPEVGYVFGGDLWVTRDGGATFTRVAHQGSTILDVEASRGDLLVLTGERCGATSCSTSVSLTRMDTSATAVPTDGAATTDLTRPIGAGEIVVRGGMAYLSLTSAADGAALPPLRYANDVLAPMSAPDKCADTSLQALTPASGLATTLFALCSPQQDGDATAYTLVRSDDGGGSWSTVSTGALRLPADSRPDLAATDTQHVAAAAAPRDSAAAEAQIGSGSLVVSSDGGRTFTARDRALGIPATGIDWLASPGGGQYYAITLNGAGYWWSTDAGDTWKVVDPAG